jgi:hypothetical protein
MTGEPRITLIPTDYVHTVWEQVRPYLEEAVEYTFGRYGIDDVQHMVLSGSHNLWAAFDDTGIKGTVVTCFSRYPKALYVTMVFCGGEDGPEWKNAMLKMLRHWAYDNNCDGIEATGRFGWQKIFKADGLLPLWQTFELPIDVEAGLGA